MPVVDQPILPRDTFDDPINTSVEIESPEADEVKNKRRMEAAAIMESDGSGTDFVQAWQTVLMQSTTTGEETRANAAAESYQKVLNENEQILGELINDAPDAAEDLVAAHGAVRTDIQTESVRKDAPYQVLTKQLQDPFKVDEQTRMDLAVRASIADDIHDMVAKQDTWNLVGDLALDLIPGKFLADAIQTTDTYNPLEWGDNLRQLVNEFRTLSPQEKMDRFPIIKEELIDKLPTFRAAQVMTAMIDPTAEDDAAFEFGVLAPVDAALTAAAMLSIANRARKGFNIIKLAEESGDTDTAAKITNTIFVDSSGVAREAVDIDELTTVNNALGMRVDIDSAAAPEIAGAVQRKISEFNKVAKEKLADLADGKGFVPESSIPEESVPKAIARIDEQFESWIQRQVDRDKITLVEKSEPQVSSNAVTFKFTVRDAEGNLERGQFTRQMQLDENDVWESLPNPGPFANLFASKKAQATNTAFLDAVNSAIRLDIADAKVRNDLGKLLTQAVAPINKLRKGRKESFNKVGEVLQYGDDFVDEVGDGLEFTVAELRRGVNGIRLTDDEIAAYSNVRTVINATADLRNSVAHRNMSQRGVRSLFWKGEGQALGVPLDTAEEAERALTAGRTVQVYHPDSGQVMQVANIEMNRWYAAGHKLVKLEEPIHVEGKGLFQTVILGNKGIQTLPQRVLRTKKGYIPRINPEAAYFVQVLSDTTLDGAAHQTRKAVRGFDNKKDAETFMARFRQQVADGETDFRTDAQVVMNRDGEIEQFSTGASQQSSATSLIYGPRKKFERLPFGLPEQELESTRLGAFESIGLYMENTKNFITRNEWRMGMQQKWENTARLATGNRNLRFTDNVKTGNTELDLAKEQIQEWSGFITKQEALYDDMVQRIYEFVLGKTGRKAGLPKRINSLKHKDPVALAKTLTFHSLLGALNPAQMIVQASGSAVALSQGFANLPKHLARVNAMAFAQHMDRAANPQLFAKQARAFGWKPSTLEKTMKFWDESGLFDSTLTSADVEAAAQGFSVSSEGVRKALNASTLFFRTGELFNRRISFMQAIEELGGIDKVLGSVQLKRQALTRTNDLLLNLGRANRAWWQRGVFSIPTQFLQIQTKTIETFLGLNGSFSTADRIKLAFAQFMLYGAAAVPFGAALTRYGLEAGGVDQTDINEEEFKPWLRGLNGGLVDSVMWSVLGADNILSDRVALLNGFDQTFLSFMEEEITPWELVGGPTGGVMKRIFDKWSVLSPQFGKYNLHEVEKNINRGTIDRVFKNLAEDTSDILLSPLSSARQVDRYIEMNNLNKILDKRGGVIAEDDFNWQTEMMALIGIKPADLDTKYTLQELNESSEKYIDYKVNQLMYNFHKQWIEIGSLYKAGTPITSLNKEEYLLVRDVVYASIESDNVRKAVQERFVERVRRLARGDTQLAKQQQEFYRLFLEDLTGDATALNSKIVQTR